MLEHFDKTSTVVSRIKYRNENEYQTIFIYTWLTRSILKELIKACVEQVPIKIPHSSLSVAKKIFNYGEEI